ncbi:MAG: AAA family ATPase [archaeon]
MSDRLWEFKYAPQKWEDLIINKDLKIPLKKALDERPNMLLYGPPGTGKGSYVDVMVNHNDISDSTMKINASLEGGIDTIREKVKSFSQASNFNIGTLKLVYLNEADHPNLMAAQQSLRQLIEDTQKLTQFVLVCNYPNNVIEELKSRLQEFNITNPPADEIFKKCEYILNNEGVKYNKKTVVEIIKRVYPDVRNTIITLRKNVVDGKLIENVQFSASDKVFGRVLSAMQSGDPEKVRKVLKTETIYYPQLYEYLYNQIMEKDSVFKNDAEALVFIGEHAYRDSVVAIKEVNFMHMVFEMLRAGVI